MKLFNKIFRRKNTNSDQSQKKEAQPETSSTSGISSDNSIESKVTESFQPVLNAITKDKIEQFQKAQKNLQLEIQPHIIEERRQQENRAIKELAKAPEVIKAKEMAENLRKEIREEPQIRARNNEKESTKNNAKVKNPLQGRRWVKDVNTRNKGSRDNHAVRRAHGDDKNTGGYSR